MDKEQILAAIRRTTAQNDGLPPGARRFSDETGIPEKEWLGRHWARWSDALRDAGLEPNTLRGAMDEHELFKSYAELVRELGYIPVRAELEMKHHRDPAFPVWQTFSRRLGSNRGVVVPRLIEYCERSGKFPDVLNICRDYSLASPALIEKISKEKRVIEGYVYLLRSGKHYKIGRSNAVGRRERELAIQLPQKGAILHKIATDDPAGIEFYWHRVGETGNGSV